MKGRKIFGGLEPYDKVWRTGADKNTKIIFSDYVVIAGVELEPGTYTIFTKPNIDTWDIYFHTLIDGYGVPDTFNPKNSVVKTTVPTVKLNSALETLAISFDNLTANSATLTIAWEKTQVSVLIEIPTEKIMKNFLSKERISSSQKYSSAAYIYFHQEKNSRKALKAIEQSITIIEGDKTFEEWLENANMEDKRLASNYYLKSIILEDLDKIELAIESAKKSLLIDEKIKSDWYIERNTVNIEKWIKH